MAGINYSHEMATLRHLNYEVIGALNLVFEFWHLNYELMGALNLVFEFWHLNCEVMDVPTSQMGSNALNLVFAF